MHLGHLHVRKRFLGTLLAVALVGGGHAAAVAEYLPELPTTLTFGAVPEPPVAQRPFVGEIDAVKAHLADHQATQRAARRTWTAADGTTVTVDQIERFLRDKASPLAAYAEEFVAAGRATGVDPRVVVAIAGIESSFGKRQLGHNAWGWGGGSGGRLSRWADWPTAIHEYTARLGERYDTDDVDEAFARRYVPPNWRHWLAAVHQFMAEVDAA